MPGNLEHPARSEALDNARSLVGHRRVEPTLVGKGERAPPYVATAAVGLDKERDRDIPTGLGEQNVSPGQDGEQRPQPSMPAPDLVHRSDEADTMTAVGAEKLIGERSGEAVTVRAQYLCKR